MWMKHFKMLIGLILCMKNFINLFRNDVWELVPRPKGVNVIGTKWTFKNTSDEHGTIIRKNQDLLLKNTHKWKGLILMRLLHR